MFSSSQQQLLAQAEQLFNYSRYSELAGIASQIILPDAKNYYLGLSTLCGSRGNIERAKQQLARVGDLPIFRVRALLALGSIGSIYTPDASGDYYCLEALKLARHEHLDNPYGMISPCVTMAVNKDIQGDHRRALLEMDRLWPLIKVCVQKYPKIYNGFLNSYSVVLTNLGRYRDAWLVQSRVLRSSLIHYHPEWVSTAMDCYRHISQKRTITVPTNSFNEVTILTEYSKEKLMDKHQKPASIQDWQVISEERRFELYTRGCERLEQMGTPQLQYWVERMEREHLGYAGS